MDYRTREVVTVLVLLGMAGLIGLVIGVVDQDLTGASVFGEACEANADCNDGVLCTVDSCKNAGSENSFCSNSPIDYCLDGDGCCPRGCSESNDDDC